MSAPNQSTGSIYSAANPTKALAFANPVLLDSDLIVGVAFIDNGTASISSVTDTLGNTYVLLGSVAGVIQPGVNNNTQTVALYYCSNIKGFGSNTVTVTMSINVSNVALVIAEYNSGLKDVNGSASGRSSTCTGPTLTLTKNNAQVIAFAAGEGGTLAVAGSLTSRQNLGPGRVQLADMYVSPAASTTPSFTQGGTNAFFYGVISVAVPETLALGSFRALMRAKLTVSFGSQIITQDVSTPFFG